MIEQTPPSPEDLTAQQTAQMLRRILDAIERKHRKRWVEIVCAIVLALATTASAWCAYESKRWSSTQTFRMAAANKAGRLASENTIAALQFRAFDASMFIAYVEAQSAGNKQMEAFLYQRFRTEMKKAVDAWLATNRSTNPLAPKSPFHMPEYQQPEALDASGQQDEANRMINQAQQAGAISDRYVLQTVLFASVLFFGGIGGTFESRKLRVTMILIALISFLITTGFLAAMPVCRQ